jgi:hypothetical protein
VASKAFLEALSSASSDKMRALAIARASAVHKGGTRKSGKEAKKGVHENKYRKRSLPSEALAAFRYLTHSLPRVTNLLIKFCTQIVREYQHTKEEVNVPGYSRTSSEEPVD